MRTRGNLAGLAVFSLLLAACSTAQPADGSNDSPSTPSTPTTLTPVSPTESPPANLAERITPVGAQASATAPNSTDSSGDTVTYRVENILDASPSTAWRVAGDGLGIEIVLDLGGTFHVTSVGLIPGYAKEDEAGIDRFAQNRRVTSVEWDFADGSSVTQAFEDSPTMQRLEVDVMTTWIRLRITGSTEHGGRDFAAISEVGVRGSPVGS